MNIKGKQLMAATVIFVLVSLVASFSVKPFSVLNFIGPAAAITSAFTLVWGYGIFVSVFAGMSAFSFILMLVTGRPLDVSVFLIATLAILLQSFWTNQLTYKIVRQQRWLKRRSLLFGFIFKIGPLAGIVSATAVVIIAIVDRESFGNSVDFIFFNTWSSSILVSVFFIPFFLFTQGSQQLSKTKRSFILFSSLLAFLAVGLLFKISQNFHQHQRVEKFNDNKQHIVELINAEILMVSGQIKSVGAFFNASKYVNFREFSLFCRVIFKEHSTLRTLAWMPLVEQKNRHSFELNISKELGSSYFIKDQLATGQVVPANVRQFYLPTSYLYPMNKNKKMLGGDHLFNPLHSSTIEMSSSYHKLVATAPVSVVQGDIYLPGIYIYYPVSNHKLFDKGDASPQKNTGYVYGIAQFDTFFQQLIKLKKADNLDIAIQDISAKEPYILLGDRLNSNDLSNNSLNKNNVNQNSLNGNIFNNDEKSDSMTFDNNGKLTNTTNFDVFSRKWQVTISENTPWINQTKSWQTWSLLMGSTLGGFVFQLLILLMAAYSKELSSQVAFKTKELLLAKENLEQKNVSKNNFLETVIGELKSPLNTVKHLVAQFNQYPTFQQSEKSIEGISEASYQLLQSIENVEYLTTIETRKPGSNPTVFALRELVNKVESILKESHREKMTRVTFVVNDKVPQFIESDMLLLQKLFIALANNANQMFTSNNYYFSIKAHLHLPKKATLFISITPLNHSNSIFAQDNADVIVAEEKIMQSTSMVMAQEMCNFLEGEIKLNKLSSGCALLSASIKVNLPIDRFDSFQREVIKK